jgi:hypothetical protein
VFDESTGLVELAFQRLKDALIPTFAVPSLWHSLDAFVILGPFKSCPPNTTLTDAGLIGALPGVTHWRWHGKPGQTETLHVAAVHGANCYAVWSLDELGRPSLTAAKFHVSIP